MPSQAQYVLALSCPNQPGIVAVVSTYLFEHDCNILDAQQYDDTESTIFFCRIVFDRVEDFEGLRAGFAPIAERFTLNWRMHPRDEKKRVMILVSRFDHCLGDLLYRWRIGELNMDLSAIVSNHPRETYAHHDFDGVPFHHLPVTRETKMEQETQLWELIRSTKTDIVVLARYMQILSDGLRAKLMGRCINIHHSFLPGFKGANP